MDMRRSRSRTPSKTSTPRAAHKGRPYGSSTIIDFPWKERREDASLSGLSVAVDNLVTTVERVLRFIGGGPPDERDEGDKRVIFYPVPPPGERQIGDQNLADFFDAMTSEARAQLMRAFARAPSAMARLPLERREALQWCIGVGAVIRRNYGPARKSKGGRIG
jgi:hypothetical protein